MSAHRKKSRSGKGGIGRIAALKFLGGFAGVMLLFYLLYYSSFYQNILAGPVEGLQANLAGVILRAMGFEAVVSGDAISGGGFAVRIAKGCDGIEPLALFLAAIIAFPIAWTLKWPGIVAGVVALAMLNIARIVGLFLVGIYVPSAFEFLHLHGGFVLFTLVAIFVWVVWANWSMKRLSANTTN